MNFIFPENYNFKAKLFGIFDYPTLILNAILLIILYGLFSIIFPNSLIWRIFMLIIFYLPIFLLSIIGFSNENFIYIAYYIIKFLIKPKVYIYK